MSESLDRAVRLLEACADSNRLRILKCLQVRPACVCELVQALQVPQPRVSRHLRTLRDAGLVVDSRDAQWVEYSLAPREKDSDVEALWTLIDGGLESDPQIVADRKGLETATRDQCVPGD